MAMALLFPTGILTSFLGTAIPECLVKKYFQELGVIQHLMKMAMIKCFDH